MIMESGSVLSEPVTSSIHRGFGPERSTSMTLISAKGLSVQPRMSQLENLEAKMANIEVSLSNSSAHHHGRRRKGTSSLGGTVAVRSPRNEPKELRSVLQDREAIIQNLRIQLCLGKLPRPTGPPLDESERPAAEQRILKLKTEAENKRIAIRNLKTALDKLDVTDNIDIRIRQAELEYALGREELQLLSIVEEARELQMRLDKSNTESHSLFNVIKSGISLSLQAVQVNVGRFEVMTKTNSPGLFIEWALEGEGLHRGDRLLELNGKMIGHLTKEEFQKSLEDLPDTKCQLVVIRKKASIVLHQQLLQQQEDNLRLQHRISYLEEQVRELQTTKEFCPATAAVNGASGHVTSISISSPPSTPPEGPQTYQRGNYFTTLVGGKPIELTGGDENYSRKSSNVTKTLIKENGHFTDTENYLQHGLESALKNNETGSVKSSKSLSSSRISINNELNVSTTSSSTSTTSTCTATFSGTVLPTMNNVSTSQSYRKEHENRAKTKSVHGNAKYSNGIVDEVPTQNHSNHHNHHEESLAIYKNHNHSHKNMTLAKSVEHLNYKTYNNTSSAINSSSTIGTSKTTNKKDQSYYQHHHHHQQRQQMQHNHRHQHTRDQINNIIENGTRKFGTDLRSVRSLDFENDINEKRHIDYTSEPATPRVRPTPPKKPLRLSLQRALSLQTVEIFPSVLTDSDKKRPLKRAHNGEKSAIEYNQNNHHHYYVSSPSDLNGGMKTINSPTSQNSSIQMSSSLSRNKIT